MIRRTFPRGISHARKKPLTSPPLAVRLYRILTTVEAVCGRACGEFSVILTSCQPHRVTPGLSVASDVVRLTVVAPSLQLAHIEVEPVYRQQLC